MTLKTNFNLPKFHKALKKMTAINYETLGKESSRLLRRQKELLVSSLSVDNLFDKNRTDKQKTYNYKEAEESIAEIKNEIHKLETMETVIAVVGTMKAGKSTTINAIVGKEILPNRNDPMTTLPTLIRNKHGQVEPLLRLNEIKPLVELTENIFKKLEQIDKSKEGLTETNPVMNGTKDGKELIQMLMKNKCYDFKSSYQGQESIFTFLRHLNDVMRLAKELGLSVEKVYSSYQESKDLPVIEVEFCHLQAMGKTANGNLSILDTPGPNEFGQSEALKTVFLHQLKRATAVMLVIDYTQMKSEAEAAVREQIESIREQLDKNRLSVLVNKFDQANATSMQKEEVQEYVASTLMNDSTLQSRVFPISAWEAYLANRTLNYLEVEGKMPDVAEGDLSWAVDFGEKALGIFWSEDISNTTRVKKSANKLWEGSFFQEPIDNVIKDSHANAAKLCVTAAVKKLRYIQELFSNTVDIRYHALGKEITQIEQAIKGLAENIKNLDGVQESLENEVNRRTAIFEEKLKENVTEYNDSLETEIDKFFECGIEQAEKALVKACNGEVVAVEQGVRDTLAHMLSMGRVNHTENKKKSIKEKFKKFKDEIQKDGGISFNEKQDARDFLDDINKGLKELSESYDKSLNEIFDRDIKELSSQVEGSINQKTNDILAAAEKTLGDSGFNLTLTPPAMTLNCEQIALEEMLNNAYKSEEETKKGWRRQSGPWGWICGKFDTDEYGWKSYEYTKTTYFVGVTKIHEDVKNEFAHINSRFGASFEKYLNTQYLAILDDYLSELVTYLDRYKGALIDGEKSQKNLEKTEAEALKIRLKTLKDHVSTQNKDLAVIDKALQEVSPNVS
jgi:signal recognition particle receptor subunit beta/predicted  nucleic acid-binding Zn-ribbon protein